MAYKFKKILGVFKPTMASKIVAAVSAIVAILLVTAVISIVEFRRMSTYVSDLMAENVRNINLSTNLAVAVDRFNLDILTVVGDADNRVTSNIDTRPYRAVADSIITVFRKCHLKGADSLYASYRRYVDCASGLDSVIVSDFIDSRDWYFTVLQPKYNDFRYADELLNEGIYEELRENSASFDTSFYRSIMPSNVSVGAAVILSLLLLFFILTYYVRPLRKMLKGIDGYRHFSQPYKVMFEGDDELKELNDGIGDMIDENVILKKRIRERER